jgi:predicted RNase H-related nuclease YkuK (DUF458 family)
MKVTQAINYEEVKDFIKHSSKESSIYVGVDSQNFKKFTKFALAIIIHIDSQHGGKVFVETYTTSRIKEMKVRLMKEVEIVVNASMQLVDTVGKRRFEVHLDINPSPEYKSNSVSKEAIGYVTGMGLHCLIKPEAWASSITADKYAKN